MIKQLWTAVSQWPVIVQGALGSALFWLVLETGRKLLSVTQKAVTKRASRSQLDRLLREYIYTKLTMHSGLAYYPQGYFITFSHVFKFFIIGMVYLAIALLLGGISRVPLAVGSVGAIYYFARALSWLIPDSTWSSRIPLDRWRRIADLEQTLFGKVDEDTRKRISDIEAVRVAGLNESLQPTAASPSASCASGSPGASPPAMPSSGGCG